LWETAAQLEFRKTHASRKRMSKITTEDIKQAGKMPKETKVIHRTGKTVTYRNRMSPIS